MSRCNSAISHIRLFEKGLSHFEGQERKGLERHLLKTQCADLANSLFKFHALDREEESPPAGSAPAAQMGADERIQVIKRVGKEEGEALLAIHKALAGENVAAFIEVFYDLKKSVCLFLHACLLFRCLRSRLSPPATCLFARATRRRTVSSSSPIAIRSWRSWRPVRSQLSVSILQ